MVPVGVGDTDRPDARADDVVAGVVPRSERDADPAVPPTAGTLVAVGPGPEPLSSADAVLQAFDHLPVSRSPDVLAADPWAEAGRKVLRHHLARMLLKVPGTIAGDDPEEVHDMRVAARRVRAAWRVFGDAFERPVVRREVGELRAIGSRLGAVRDFDVLIGILATARDRRSKRERVALGPLLDDWQGQRAARHAELVAELASPWFGEFVTDHEGLVTTPGSAARPVAPHAPATVRTRTPAVAWEAYEAVWAFDDVIGGPDVATLHELRIAAKWLRYTLEFLREPLEPGATELIRRVVVLQDHLGDIHDLHAAATLAHAFTVERADLRPAQRTAIERFATSQDARVERLRGRIGPAWRGVSDAEYRRLLGRSLARL